MRTLRVVVIALCSCWLFSQPALAGKRVALIIGNSAYRSVAPLRNPVNDAAVVAAMFKRAGFDVVDSRRDLKVTEMRRALREFGNQTSDADIAVIYYAGHGMELDGNNYLIPVDAELESDTDVFDEALSLDRVLVAVEPAKQLRLVILDACRDNPFSRTMKRTIGSRSVGRGLAKVEPSSPNTMIAFAAKAGSVASDGDTNNNSPFAIALVEHLTEPGLDLRKAFGFVRDDVLKATSNAQEPFIYGSLGGNDVALVPAAPSPAPAVNAPADQDAAVRRDYEFADRFSTKPVWDAFIEKYPSGFYTELARARRDKLVAEAEKVAAGAKAAEVKKVTDDKSVGPVAALSPPEQSPQIAAKPDQPALADIPRLLQTELRRVGCLTGTVGKEWDDAAQRSLGLFNKKAGMNFDVKVASLDALDAVRSRTSRVCPLICSHGYRSDGDECTKIRCGAGSFLNDDNECEREQVRERTPHNIRRENSRVSVKPEPSDGPARQPQASGQIVCGRGGCHPVQQGCHLEERSVGLNANRAQVEICR